ncbi:fumarate reductase subunit FrdC [Pasteurella atlantica]|uniref:fumarate reductase subunit FrdC n=1 Tax=Pasteurellaceae TaxID=712 RepID=UPI0027605954|nr:fumarate reductase subunit FrdC [Pasteurella atlantica]MDP8033233.1 fumarate reductase subunit FrdC [Pasteurella atlantica]MDP8035217.1 fumarate reductase subunit FrdC [Pasteurella atlantica]MDP8037167.1 fumarate reductase subunit FrdC [Pasteurella atlantica]MDP8047354.1 fumarate reductase subunit FrdC [Pasteurella atlantica]MDP8049422.1 fumarate reductase subunit FrdC [Pasteurella atlantica]
MTTETTKRKKYVREMTPTWWKKLDFYKLYIAREATAVPTLWFCLVLLYGVICLGGGVEDVKANFIPFLQNPVVVIFNIITLGAVILNTVTYYFMTPKVLNIIVKNQRINPNIITGVLWGATAFVSLVILVLMYI